MRAPVKLGSIQGFELGADKTSMKLGDKFLMSNGAAYSSQGGESVSILGCNNFHLTLYLLVCHARYVFFLIFN